MYVQRVRCRGHQLLLHFKLFHLSDRLNWNAGKKGLRGRTSLLSPRLLDEHNFRQDDDMLRGLFSAVLVCCGRSLKVQRPTILFKDTQPPGDLVHHL